MATWSIHIQRTSQAIRLQDWDICPRLGVPLRTLLLHGSDAIHASLSTSAVLCCHGTMPNV